MPVKSVKRIHQSDWTDEGIRFLRARDIVSYSKGESPKDKLYISREKYDEYSEKSGKVKPNDLLVTGVGSIGIPMLIRDTNPIYFKDGNIIWFQNNNAIDGNFLYYSFKTSKITSFISNVSGSGTVGTYTIDSGKQTPIDLPEKHEQQKIGSLLSKLDSYIAANHRKHFSYKITYIGQFHKVFPRPPPKLG